MKGTVGYILRRFPVLSEAFVLEEILALEAQGIPVRIYVLSRSRDSRYHANLAKLKSGITYVPELGEIDKLYEANRAAARTLGRSYFEAFRYAASKANVTMLWWFIQAGYLAMNLRRRNIQHLHAHFATRATSVALLSGSCPPSLPRPPSPSQSLRSHAWLRKKAS